jgi:ABC-2 type transport system permease protein
MEAITWAMRAEWTKLRSVRSTRFALAGTAAVCIGLAALISAATAGHWRQIGPADRLFFDPTGRSLRGLFLGQLVLGTLGVLAMSAEFTTGTIRASVAAVPRRARLFWAKTAVFLAVAGAVSAATVLAAFALGQALLHPRAPSASLSQPGVLGAVVGAAVYLTAVALIGLGVGAVVRSTAAGVSTLVGLVFVLPLLSEALPSSLRTTVQRSLPSTAGFRLSSVARTPDTVLSDSRALLVLGLWVAAALVAGCVMLVRRDV